jgi:uncharacterized protein YjbI with pentapeptide repeats
MAGRIEVALARKRHPRPNPALTRRLLDVLASGVEEWNGFRREHPDLYIDLRGVDLSDLLQSDRNLDGADFSYANLSDCNLSRLSLATADLRAAYANNARFEATVLDRCVLRGAYFSECNFQLANFLGADLRVAGFVSCTFLLNCFEKANLRDASFMGSDLDAASFDDTTGPACSFEDAVLRGSSFRRARLQQARLTGASMIDCDFSDAVLNGASVFGVSFWRCKLDRLQQRDLVITPEGEPDLTVDDVRVAQFIYLILNNEEIRHLIDNITSKVVLILGSFSAENKVVLQSLKEDLRAHNYSPVLFDFQRPRARNFLETVATMAGMARFVVADLTTPKMVLREIDFILRTCPSTPVATIIRRGEPVPASVLDFSDFGTFLEPVTYEASMLAEALLKIIPSAEALAEQIAQRRAVLAGRLSLD